MHIISDKSTLWTSHIHWSTKWGQAMKVTKERRKREYLSMVKQNTPGETLDVREPVMTEMIWPWLLFYFENFNITKRSSMFQCFKVSIVSQRSIVSWKICNKSIQCTFCSLPIVQVSNFVLSEMRVKQLALLLMLRYNSNVMRKNQAFLYT